ncbi:methylene-fatty-acyl-phospholipid synthase [Ceratobasidium sp. AG-Ba]|nr:methylene-fatty-acyl-phospholipid synthase [Ceratobasidium sp. AG-Ba]
MSISSYIAGLNLPFSNAQLLNGLACGATVGAFYFALPTSAVREAADREAGKIAHMPPGRQGEIITLTHTLGLLGPALVFTIGLPLNRFETPDWLLRFTLPPASSSNAYYGLRFAGVVGALGCGAGIAWTTKALAAQWHFIGVRERPKLVKTGPYAIVRHPMYSFGILMDLVSAVMYWNWIPLAGAALTTVAFAIKIPMEEKLILNKKGLGDAYKQYRREVPSCIIPYIW